MGAGRDRCAPRRKAAEADVIGRGWTLITAGSRFLVIAREATQSRHHRRQRRKIASPLSGSQ
jgi:hypothetical protein